MTKAIAKIRKYFVTSITVAFIISVGFVLVESGTLFFYTNKLSVTVGLNLEREKPMTVEELLRKSDDAIADTDRMIEDARARGIIIID